MATRTDDVTVNQLLDALKFVVDAQSANWQLLASRFHLGKAKAERLVEILTSYRVIGAPTGSYYLPVLVGLPDLERVTAEIRSNA